MLINYAFGARVKIKSSPAQTATLTTDNLVANSRSLIPSLEYLLDAEV